MAWNGFQWSFLYENKLFWASVPLIFKRFRSIPQPLTDILTVRRSCACSTWAG